MNSWLNLVLSGLFSLPCAVSMLRCRLLARSCAKWRNHFRVSPEKGMKKWRRVRNWIQENQNRFCYEEFICDRWKEILENVPISCETGRWGRQGKTISCTCWTVQADTDQVRIKSFFWRFNIQFLLTKCSTRKLTNRYTDLCKNRTENVSLQNTS